MKAKSKYYVTFDKENPKTSKFPPYDIYFRLALSFEWVRDDKTTHEFQLNGCLLNYHTHSGMTLSMPRVRGSRMFVALMNDQMKADIIADIVKSRPDVWETFKKHEDNKPIFDDTKKEVGEE